MWYPTLLGGDFAPMLDAIEATVRSIGETNDADRETNPRRDLCVVGHSAGGWLARLWMGDAPYVNGRVYGGAPRVKTLLTLGTPHNSLEEYPFGRVPERLADVVKTGSNGSSAEGAEAAEGAEGAEGAHPVWTAQRACTSSLSLTNFLYPGAWAAPGVRYVSVRGDAVAAASIVDVAVFLTLGTLGNFGTLGTLGEVAACVGAGVSYRTATGGDSAPGDSPPGVLRGDGVAPVEAATLDGSERVTLVGVTHQATSSRGDGDAEGAEVDSRGRWYGSPRVVTAWARRLLEPTPGGEETVFEWEIAGKGMHARTADENKRRYDKGDKADVAPRGSYDATALASALEAALNGGSDTLENVDIAAIAPFAGVDDRRTVSSTVTTVSTSSAAGSLLWQCCLAARNRVPGATTIARALLRDARADPNAGGSHGSLAPALGCLLYTSDAADE